MIGSKVVVKIDAVGGVQMDAIGFTGNACDKATSQLMVALNGQTVKDTKKPEFRQASSAGVGQALKRF